MSARASGPRVTVLLPNLAGGGAERVMLTVAGGLATAGADVLLLLGDASGQLGGSVPANVVTRSMGRAHLRDAVPSVARHLRRDRPDCLLSTLEHANVVALAANAMAGAHTPVAVRVANTLSETAAADPSPKDRLALLAARRLYPRARAVIAPSRGVADDLEAVIGTRVEHLLRVIPNPVVGTDLAARAAAPLDHPWFAPGQPPVLLTVGSLTAKKNHALLLRATAALLAETRVRVLILGEGPERARLAALAASLGLRMDEDVSMPGWVDDPFPYLARCSVYVLTSDREGLPGALIQALACGARVVATDCRSGPSEILARGRLGRLVPVGDSAAMTSAIRATLAEQPAASPSPDVASTLAAYTVAGAVGAYVSLVDELATAGALA